MNDRYYVNLKAIKVVMIFWLLGWTIKSLFFFPYLLGEIVDYPIIHPLFPEFFRSPTVAQLAYFLPWVGFLALLSEGKRSLIATSCLFVLASLVLMCHSDTYNDATFVTSFWSGLWLLWFAVNLDRTDGNLRLHACALAQSMIGIIFLGGAVGKFTPEYWNGTIIYNVFFFQGQDGLARDIIHHLSIGQQKVWAMYFSRMIIFTEGFLVLSPLWPTRFIATIGPIFILAITFFSTWRILSVVACLIGLFLGCLYLQEPEDGHDA